MINKIKNIKNFLKNILTLSKHIAIIKKQCGDAGVVQW